ncbi:MAG: tRNA pseudouridine(38-40) synthase TruA [Actinomycetota bacterium]
MTTRSVLPPPAGHVRVRMTVAYDGTPFHGFATNPGVETVQDAIEAVLETVLRQPTPITCAGRTDRGVHAQGQVVSFDADAGHFEPMALTRALNRMLAPSIAVRGVRRVADDFDARFSCVARSYRYRVLNAATPDPLVHHLVWHVREPLDLAAMQLAADAILGEHDFSTFSKRNKSKPKETYVRTVQHAQWSANGPTVSLDIRAGAFTHQMVRSLVGMFVEIGRGRRRAVDMGGALRARDRAVVPSPAPPRGLVLATAHYHDDA